MKLYSSGARKMIQMLRAISALLEDLNLVPSTSMTWTAIAGEMMASSDLCGHCMHMECIPTHMHIQEMNKPKKAVKSKIEQETL